MGFKDLFSGHSSDYARYRPHYPQSLVDWASSLAPAPDNVWDCGTGNGQAAVALAERFQRVIATDPSEEQLKRAAPHPRVEYRVGQAECSGLSDRSCDLVAVAQALHWFDLPKFATEAARVSRPGAALVAWSYALAAIDPAIDTVVLELYRDVLGEYWEPERKLVEEGYRVVRLPFGEIPPPQFEMTAEWTLAEWLGYLCTWSAVKTYLQRRDQHPVEAISNRIAEAWGSVPKRLVRWPLAVRAWRLP